MSPFFSIWFSPRATISRIVTTNPTQYTWALMIAPTFFAVLDMLITPVPLDPVQPIAAYHRLGLWGSLLMAAVLAPLGIPTLRPLAMLYRWVAAKFRGVASREDMAAVIAWSAWPLVVAWAVSWAVRLAMFGGAVFTSIPEATDAQSNVEVGLLLMQFVGLAFCLVILVAGAAEVSRFGVMESVATNFIATLIVVVPLIVVVVIAVVTLLILLMPAM